jgi:hypothetical protein
MTTPVKIKRRITPTLVVDDNKTEQKGNIASKQFPTDALAKHYENILNIEKKYTKPSKATVHGDHHKYLDNLQDYIVEYCKLKNHTSKPTQTMFNYLKKNFDNHKYYSVKTKRFRKRR